MSGRREFIKQIGFGAVGVGMLPSWVTYANMPSRDNSMSLPRSTPEQQGVSSEAIAKFLDAIRESGQEFHSVMVLRHGHVIGEGWWSPYSSEHRQQLYSLSKSFTSTAVGFAVDEKLLSVEDTVISFFPDLLPEVVSENLAALKVRHLLSMSVGHGQDSIRIIEVSPKGTPWQKTFLSLPVVEKPGSKFMYNSGASFMLSAIVTKLTGKSAHAYLTPRLFEPLGIAGSTWTTNPDGINIGASHLRIRTEDIAKFGQFYLQGGMWNGKQLLSKAWVTAATTVEIENGKRDSSWAYGYGYQFWMNPPGGFRADGAFGQFSMVFPEQDAVVAITSESISTKTTMQIVWDNLVPALNGKTALPGNTPAVDSLRRRFEALSYEPPKALATSPLSSSISGKQFVLEKNDFNVRAVSFTFSNDACVFTLMEAGKPDIKITNGIHKWVRKGNLKPEPHSLFSLRRIDFDSIVAASATWLDEKTLLLTWRFIETVHGDSLTCIFDNNQVKIKLLFSVPRLENKPDDRTELTGTLAS